MITIKEEINLQDFDFWGGAEDIVKELTAQDFSTIEESLSDIFPDGMTETALNDIFWFERDMIAEWIGYANWEDLLENR